MEKHFLLDQKLVDKNRDKNSVSVLESKEKFIPKVEFCAVSFEGRLQMMKNSSNHRDSYMRTNFYNSFPGLYGEVKDNKSWEFRKPIFEKYLKNNSLKEEEYSSFLESCKRRWKEEHADEYIERLCNILDFREHENIIVYLQNINGGAQYNAYTNNVLVNWGCQDKTKFVCHEITHMPIFFKIIDLIKIKENREAQHMIVNSLEHKISEILVPIIMKEEMLFLRSASNHKFLYENKINNKTVLDYFTEIYLNSKNSGDSFDTTLEKIYDEAKLHEEELK